MSAVTQNFQRWTFLFLGLVFAAGAVVPVAARSANPVTAAFVASSATAIPGGRSNFTNFYQGSPIGNYPCSPFKIANLAMPIPGGVGNFTSLALLASTPRSTARRSRS